VELLLIVAVFLVVVAIVAAPLRAGHAEETERRESAELADLEAAKEAKYREIRDAEMDFRTGKLDGADHKALDRQLRAEAIDILRELDELEG
jgi:flagellar biosynthesis/type III secretory pathway M-ring protein FliF/YscJ